MTSKAKGMKRSQPRRNWSSARSKVEAEAACRWCKDSRNLEAAHVIGREHDAKDNYFVWPARIVPLCRHHHRLYDAHDLDLLGYLTPEEEAQAVLDAGSLESARRRLAPTLYRQERAAA